MQLSLALTKEEFTQQLLAAQTARMQAGTTSPAQPALSTARPAKPAQITIYGLDGGPRVIQTTH